MANMGWSMGWGLGLNPWSFMALLIIWTLFWKGVALWKSARSGSKVWFIVFLLVNTAGILEILYIFLFSEKNFKWNLMKDSSEKHHEKSGHHSETEKKEETSS